MDELAEREHYGAQYLNYVTQGVKAGWLSADEGDERLYQLIDPHTLEWLREATAALGDLDAEHSYRQWRAVQDAHAAALAEDAERTDLHGRLRYQLRHALTEGAIDRAGAQVVLDQLVGADAGGIRHAVVDVAEMRCRLMEAAAPDPSDEYEGAPLDGEGAEGYDPFADPDTLIQHDDDPDDGLHGLGDQRPSREPRMG